MSILIQVETVDDLQSNWRDPYAQWWYGGMPSFFSENLEPWKQIKIKFRTIEDRNTFAEKMGYSLTEKTNGVWYPEKDRHPNSMNRYVGD
jgi:hypothetical protein